MIKTHLDILAEFQKGENKCIRKGNSNKCSNRRNKWRRHNSRPSLLLKTSKLFIDRENRISSIMFY